MGAVRSGRFLSHKALAFLSYKPWPKNLKENLCEELSKRLNDLILSEFLFSTKSKSTILVDMKKDIETPELSGGAVLLEANKEESFEISKLCCK